MRPQMVWLAIVECGRGKRNLAIAGDILALANRSIKLVRIVDVHRLHKQSRVQPEPEGRQSPTVRQNARVHFGFDVGSPDLDELCLPVTEVKGDLFIAVPPLENNLAGFTQGDVR